MGNRIAVVFLWHMHQPVYKDPVSGEIILPWVRLHAVKDYIDMATTIADVPGTKAVINVVPSLMEQLLDETTDRFFDLSMKPAEVINDAERAYLVEHFFSAHQDNMIRPFQRYQYLFEKFSGSAMPVAPEQMTEDEVRDLQVWFNLAWCGETIQREPEIAALIEKGRHFSEEDKLLLLERHRRAEKDVLPLYRDLMDKGILEVATTPFYHPILPLLINIEEALICNPGAPLPDEPFSYPVDAVRQVEEAIVMYNDVFGRPPVGMWPAEGSVSERALHLLIAGQLRWAATDEGILYSSLDNPNDPTALFRCHTWNGLNLFFRDRHLSDRIGFVYSKWNPDHAAADFINQLENRYEIFDQIENPVVPIILDGENAWEYYTHGGMEFLKKMYQALADHPRFYTTTFSEFLEQKPKTGQLNRIRCGSWINSDFSTWIGDPVKNAAWSLLARARNAVEEDMPEDLQQRRHVLEALSVAEGSDWFWWFGEGHACAHEPEFDMLFRNWVSEIYRRINRIPPAELNDPLTTVREEVYTQPLYLMQPTITGVVESYYKWLSAGHCSYQEGAISQAQPLIKELFFGFDAANLYVRIDMFDRPARQLTEEGYRVYLLARRPSALQIELVHNDNSKFGDVIESRIAFCDLGGPAIEPMTFFIMLCQGEQEVERFPLYEPIILPFPARDFGQSNWIV